MATIGDMVYTFGADLSGLDRGIDQSKQKVGGLGGVLQGALSTMTGFVGAQVGMQAIGGAFGFIKDAAIGMNASLQTSELQFTTLMGNADQAKAHVAGLFEFAGKTPFETGPIIEASRMLQTFGGTALNTMDNMTLMGDAAAAVSAPINEVAFWAGRAYSAIQGGQPFGEAAARLQELAIMSPQARQEMEALQKSGASASEVWAVMEKDLGKFTGAMEKQAGTWGGLTSTFSDSINLLTAAAFKPFFELVSGGLAQVNTLLSSPAIAEGAANIAQGIANGLKAAGQGISGFIELIDGPVMSGIDRFRGILSAVSSIISGVLSPAIDTLSPIISALAGYFGAVADDGDYLNDFLTHLPAPLAAVAKLVGQLFTHFGDLMTVLNPVASFIRQFISLWGERGLGGAIRGIPEILGNIADSFKTIGGFVKEALTSLGGMALDAVRGVDWGAVGSRIMDALGDALSTAGDVGSAILGAIGSALAGVDWGGAFSRAGDIGGQVLGAISTALTSVDWTGLAATIGTGIVTGLGAVADWGSQFLTWMSGQLGAVDWTALAATIINGIMAGITAVADWGTRFVTWVSAQLSAVDWTATGQAILSGILVGMTATADFGQQVADFIGGAIATSDMSGPAAGIATSLSAGFGAVDWSALSAAFAGLWESLQPLLTAIGEAAAGVLPAFRDIWATITSQFSSSTPLMQSLQELWVSLQPAIAAVVPILEVLGTILGAVLVVAIAGLMGHLNGMANVFAAVLPAAIQVLTGAIQVVTGVIEVISAVIEGVIKIVVGLLTGDWALAWEGAQVLVEGVVDGIISIVEGLANIVDGLISGMVGAVLGYISGFVDAVIGFFQNLFQELVGGSIVPDMINGIIGAFLRLPSEAVQAVIDMATAVITQFGTLLTDVVGKAGELVTGVITALGRLIAEAPAVVSGFVASVLGFFSDLLTEGVATIGEMVTGIVTKLGELVTDATTKAGEVMTGFIGAITGRLGDVANAAGQIKSSVLGAFGDAASWLLGAGGDIIGGLVQGISDNIPSVSGVLGTVTDLVPDWKGPADKDRQLLRPAGQMIIEGLVDGFQDRFRWVQDTLTSLGDLIQQQVNADVNARHDAIAVSASQYAQALIDGLAAGSELALQHAQQLNDDVVLTLADMMADAQGALDMARIAGAAPEDIAELEAQLAQVTAVLQTFADTQGTTIQEIIDTSAGAGAITDVWMDVLNDLDGIASGDVMAKLQEQLTSLTEQLEVALAGEAPQAVLDALNDSITDVQDQIELVGGVVATGLVDGAVGTLVDGETRDRITGALNDLLGGVAETVPEAVDYIGSILDGSLAESLQDAILDQRAAINFAVANNWPAEIIDAMESELGAMTDEYHAIMEQLGIAAAEGLVDPSVLVELEMAAETLYQIPIDKLKDIAPHLEDGGLGLVKDIVAGVVDGSATFEDAMEFLDTMSANAMDDLESTIGATSAEVIEHLEDMASALRNDLAQAMIDGTDPTVLEQQLQVVLDMLGAVTDQANAAAESVGNVGAPPGYSTLDPGGNTGGGGGGGGGAGGATEGFMRPATEGLIRATQGLSTVVASMEGSIKDFGTVINASSLSENAREATQRLYDVAETFWDAFVGILPDVPGHILNSPAFENYVAAMTTHGDALNDWITHIPAEFREIIKQWGLANAETIKAMDDVAKKAGESAGEGVKKAAAGSYQDFAKRMEAHNAEVRRREHSLDVARRQGAFINSEGNPQWSRDQVDAMRSQGRGRGRGGSARIVNNFSIDGQQAWRAWSEVNLENYRSEQ